MMGCGWPMIIGMLVVWTLVVGGVVAGVVFAVRALQEGRADHRRGRDSSALTILEERYARGEIGEEEFVQRRAALLAGR